MKALIYMTLLAMTASAIAIPISKQAKVKALLEAMMDEKAEMEGWLSTLVKKYGPGLSTLAKKYGPGILKTGLEVAKNIGGDELISVQELAAMQEKAELEGWLSSLVKKYGPGLLKTGLDVVKNIGGDELERELADMQEKTEMEEFENEVKKYGPSLLKIGRNIASSTGNEQLKRQLAAIQEKAEKEGWFSNVVDAVKTYGPGLLKTGLSLAG